MTPIIPIQGSRGCHHLHLFRRNQDIFGCIRQDNHCLVAGWTSSLPHYRPCGGRSPHSLRCFVATLDFVPRQCDCSAVWNIKSEEAITSVKAHQSAVTSLQVDATKAVSCGMDMIVQVTDIIQGHVLQTLRGHIAPIFAVAFDQRQIVSASSDGEIRFWSWGR
eukprot:scaffold19317_cov76-Skeletonema_dohrnii-CCMP3373.AAC.1